MKYFKLLVHIWFLLSLLSIGAICSGIPTDRKPALPEGFTKSLLPDVPLQGYFYLSGGQGLKANLDQLIPDFQSPLDHSYEVNVKKIIIWLAPDPRNYAILFHLDNETEVRTVLEALNTIDDRPFEYFEDHNQIYIINGNNSWKKDITTAIQNDHYVTLKQAYPDVNTFFNLLPQKPNSLPVGAGFGIMNNAFIDILDGMTTIGLSPLQGFVNGANIDNIILALYSDEPPQNFTGLNNQMLTEMELGAVLATRSTYPGFMVSLVFDSVAKSSGLQHIELKDSSKRDSAYYISPYKNTEVIIKNSGSDFYITISTDRSQAEQLMMSTLDK